MSRDAPPYPPQMRNGGSPPAHLSSSYLSDPSWWLHFKWLQPPPRAPKWLFDYYKSYNPAANVGRPLQEENWHQRAIREDQQAAGLLLPECEGPILHGARALADHAYKNWKAAIDDLWADNCEALLVKQATHTRQEEAACCQRLLDKHVACACQQEAARQEAARAAQHVLHERAALKRQVEAAHLQCLLDKWSALCRHAAQAWQTAAARVIFLWLHRRRLFAQLAPQTSRRLQREATLTRMQHEQECCARALQAEEQRRQAAAMRAKAIADEANKRHRQAKAAIGEQLRQAATARGKASAQATVERHRHKATAASVELAHLFRMRGLPLPPWKQTRRKYRPNRTCGRH